ncbi:hypothetical protein PF008_g12794 [Phytophthora fragariae]|uniref:Uncharacterized protein n=1 Tax=Phytophthora fragariae TaxID=53985 RepID=A0A6G0RMC0_9STRA|nr:hypothetical protein PF008_g12794 [Phytophthora fragariae]
MRDQASDEEKCLTLAELQSGPAKNWYRQLPRSTRNKWTELLKSFQVQYCGFGISVARQYYQARKRSDESALEYLHRLNVAGLRARLKVKDGGTKERKEHVGHFIETLGDPELADRLTLLRLSDADDLEEVLRALDRAKSRQKKTTAGSSRCRQRPPRPQQRVAPSRWGCERSPSGQHAAIASANCISQTSACDTDPRTGLRVGLQFGRIGLGSGRTSPDLPRGK